MVHTQLVSCLSGLPRASCEITCVRSGVEGLLQASGEPACARGEQEFSCAALQLQVECKIGDEQPCEFTNNICESDAANRRHAI